MTPEYSLFEKQALSSPTELSDRHWDVFISGFSKEERVNEVFDCVKATKKRWIGLSEYGLTKEDYPDNCVRVPGSGEESLIVSALSDSGLELSTDQSICIDATGILRQYLLVLLRALSLRRVIRLDVIYSEPSRYGQHEETRFSGNELLGVRQIQGYEGSHTTDTRDDLVIIGTGYEDRLVGAAAEAKNHARKHLLYAFPSLQADMYQQSALATTRVHESIGRNIAAERSFAPAHDPFETASRLRDIVSRYGSMRKISNLYLVPLATKPMALGFGLYYLWECNNTPTSILTPIVRNYSPQVSRGIKRVWLYRVELPG